MTADVRASAIKNKPYIIVGLLLVSVNVLAAEVVFQALDSVKTNSKTAVLDMAFDDPRRSVDFVNSGISGADFKACQLTAIDGLYCLDGDTVRHWPNSEDPATFSTVINCAEPELNLDTKKANACTGMTVDLTGAIWLAGKNKGKTHSLIKAVAEGDSCDTDAGFKLLSASGYCVKEVATGRPLLIDITPIDGDFGATFPHGPGILGLEERKTAVFFPESGAPIELASGKRDFGLLGGEQLTGITATQVTNDADETTSYVLVTTTKGRVLSMPVTGGTKPEAFIIPDEREMTSMQCNFDDPSYGIRASTKSGLVYVTDRQYCEVIALKPQGDPDGNFARLINVTEPDFDNPIPNSERNLTLSTATLSTADAPAATFPPEGATVAPGISIDLNDCTGSCALVFDEDGVEAATLSNVSLANELISGLTLFQVKNIPDCRYVPGACRNLLGVTDLVAARVVRQPDDILYAESPQAQMLNLTKLLPKEITDLFEADGGLPDMYLSKEYRGQKNNGFTFEAFFGVTEEGVVFRDTFEGEFEVEALVGTQLGCKLGLPNFSPLYTDVENAPDEIGTLNWDIVNTVSERFVSRVNSGGSTGPDRVSTMTNAGCNSSKTRDGRWSIKPYNLEITPCTYNSDTTDVWASDGCTVDAPESPDDAVLAKLLLTLFDELGASLDDLACADVDAGALWPWPLSATSCSTLNANWLNAKDKLDKCWEAMQQPKQSAGDQNCQAFVSQLNNFENILNGAAIFGPDPANRLGELKARMFVIRHLYEERVVPSLDAAGFCEPDNPDYDDGCP